MNKVQLRLVEECEENESKLNTWERGFIDNLATKYSDKVLSIDQNKILNRINSKVVFGG